MMLGRLGVVLALVAGLSLAAQQKPVADRCPSDARELSPHQIKARVLRTEPILPPCCAEMLHLNGTAVFGIAVDAQGKVIWLEAVSAHPLITGSILASVSKWEFRPYISRGRRKKFCGKIIIDYQGNERAIKFEVIEGP